MNLDLLREKMTSIFLEGKEYARVKEDEYTDFSYPKTVKLMKFHTERFRIPGFGTFMTMLTRATSGMELLTVSIVPGEGVSVPCCLMDIMVSGKKRDVLVEYYDVRAEKTDLTRLEKVAGKFAPLKDHKEKPHWYTSERAPYSLIKCGGQEEDQILETMALISLKAYNAEISHAGTDPSNIIGLKRLRHRMINEGNPASSTLEKVFGKEGVKDFITQCVMPL